MTDTTINKIRSSLISRFDFTRDLSNEEIYSLIDNEIIETGRHQFISLTQKEQLRRILFNSIRGYDILQELIDDHEITEIMINGYNNIFIEKDGSLIKSDFHFSSPEKLQDVIQQIVSNVNRRVNEASPIADARLYDGSRVNIVLNPIALNGPAVTIRKFSESPMTIQNLIDFHSITIEAADYLKQLVLSGYNIFVCGGTGSGKTTFLNALSNFIPVTERVITIEDSAELQISNIPNLVRLEARQANTEGKNEITIRDLIRSALRMRPNRLLVGEIRGAEALDMLTAFNTGHDGSMSTGHGNSPKDMLRRMETMVLMGVDMPVSAIKGQIASALDIMIYLGRLRDHSRRVLEITEIADYKNDEIILNPLFVFHEEEEIYGKIRGTLKRTNNPLINTLKLQMAGIKEGR
ncbi:MAG: CpaF family protein [Lachnospiraceae bacterium]|jgi:Flp pilus assembly protein, ATPase CpaF|nr:CpaF family protein [Lachnospiraceae bacterium]MCI8825025.1 CpaF family protein [Lachnospiraceae bacterium]